MDNSNTEHYEHKYYKHVADEKNADAVAWSFVNGKKFVKFPFNFPEILPDEIRANVTFTGLCHSDSFAGRGEWNPNTVYPIVAGHEIAGEVSVVGSNVKDFKVGDTVAFGVQRDCCGRCRCCVELEREVLCQKVAEKFTYNPRFGGYATQLQQPAKFFYKIPSNMDIKRLPPLLCAGATVWGPIKRHIRKGDKAAVLGVGGLGHLAVQFLAKLGHEVVGLTTSSDKKDFIMSLGGTQVVNVNIKEELDQILGKIDFVINTLPTSDMNERLFAICAPAAKWVQVGLPALKENNTNVPCNLLIINEIEVIGSLIGTRKEINEMLQFCNENNIYPMVEEFSFDDFPKALDRLENGRPKFRCVVNVQEYSKSHGLFK